MTAALPVAQLELGNLVFSEPSALLLVGAVLGVLALLMFMHLGVALITGHRRFLSVGIMFGGCVLVNIVLAGLMSGPPPVIRLDVLYAAIIVSSIAFSGYSLGLIRAHDTSPFIVETPVKLIRLALLGCLLAVPFGSGELSLLILVLGWLLFSATLIEAGRSTWHRHFPRISLIFWGCEWVLISLFTAQLLHWVSTPLPLVVWLLMAALLEAVHTCAGFVMHYLNELAEQQQMRDDLKALVHERDAALRAECEANESLESKVRERTFELEITLRELEDVNEQLEKQTTHDFLTGVRNRNYFDRRYLAESRRSRREQRPLAIVMLDIDHFKAVNDTYGHVAGDDVIRAVAQRIREHLHRPGDEVTRYGGEEFALILPNTPLAGARSVAQEIIDAISQSPVSTCEGKLDITVSAGVSSSVVLTSELPVRLLEQADEALYRAKAIGRNRVECCQLDIQMS